MAAETRASHRHKAAYHAKRGSGNGAQFDASRLGDNATVLGNSSYSTIQALVNGDSSLVSAKELGRMQMTATGAFEKEAAARQAAEAAAKDGAVAKAQARKEHMKKLEDERKAKLPPSDLALKRKEDKAAVLSASEKKMAEELDDVKKMNQMCLYSKIVTIRDRQVEEKKVIEKERQEEERRLDTIMEIERLKALKMYEDREARRKLDQKLGAQVIVDQMAGRERGRVRKLELQDQEREAMLRQNEELKAEETRVAALKIEQGKRLLDEVATSNAEQISLKRLEKEREREEERRIAAYIREKEAREQEHLQEQERAKTERELETERLRVLQEKMKDKQAEMDSLRARRAAEEAERNWREKERMNATRQEEINATLSLAREAQCNEKERRLVEQAQQEKEEFERILRVQREAEELERLEKERRAHAARAFKEELQTQILMNAEVRKKDRMDFLHEGNQMRTQREADRLKLEGIKMEKLGALHRAGVPQKYTVDLANKKFT